MKKKKIKPPPLCESCKLPALCKSCGKQGLVALGMLRPRWCKCPRGRGGPYVAPPGHVTCFVYTRVPS